MTKTSKRRERTLRDRLAHLHFDQACKLLGTDGKRLLREGGKYLLDVDIDEHVYLRGDLFRLTLPQAHDDGSNIRVTITKRASNVGRLCLNCDACQGVCIHQAAALSFILEEKFALGLSELPKEGVPLELLNEQDLVQRAIAERALRAKMNAFG